MARQLICFFFLQIFSVLEHVIYLSVFDRITLLLGFHLKEGLLFTYLWGATLAAPSLLAAAINSNVE